MGFSPSHLFKHMRFCQNGRVMKPQISGVKINTSPRVVFVPETSWVLMLVQHV